MSKTKEELKKSSPVVDTEVENVQKDEEVDLQKSLDENLKTMDELVKSGKKKNELKDMMKDESTRKKIKDLMKEYDEEDEDEDEDEEESKVKKSLDNVIEENDEIIDAVPVLKSFAEVISKVVDAVDMIKSKIEDISNSIESNNEIVKSFSNVIETESKLVKSMSETVDKIGSQPQKVKGVVNKGEILNKSFNSEDGTEEENKFSPALVKSALLKGFQDGKVSAGSISKWEMSRYNLSMLLPDEVNFVKSFIEGGK